MRLDVLIQNRDELGDDLVALQRGEQAAIDVDRGFRFFEGAGQRDADVGVLRFAGAVDHAAHHGDFHFFDARVAVFPDGHLLAQVGLDLLGHFLEEGAGGASAAGAGGDLRGEAANAERLQNLLADADFFGAVAAGRRA